MRIIKLFLLKINLIPLRLFSFLLTISNIIFIFNLSNIFILPLLTITIILYNTNIFWSKIIFNKPFQFLYCLFLFLLQKSPIRNSLLQHYNLLLKYFTIILIIVICYQLVFLFIFLILS